MEIVVGICVVIEVVVTWVCVRITLVVEVTGKGTRTVIKLPLTVDVIVLKDVCSTVVG